MKNKKGVFPGSFDPITLGHIDIIHQSLELFEHIVIGIGINESKNHMFNIEERKDFINLIFKKNNRVSIKEYSGLTVDFCKQEKAYHIIRGIRSTIDFEYEKSIALANYELNSNINTILLPAKKEHIFISSTLVKEIIIHKGILKKELQKFIPLIIIKKILNQLS